MIIFLYGPDTYRSLQKFNEIVERYKKIHQSGFNLKYFEGEDFDFQDFQKEVRSTPMFQEKKLIVLKRVLSNENFKENFLKEGKKFVVSKDTILLFWEEGGELKEDRLVKFFKKNAQCQEFKLLTKEKLLVWARKEMAKYKTRIEKNALFQLVDSVGNNLWQMANEIKKLASYKNGKIIEIEDVELLIKPKIETDIFKTITALSSRDKKTAINLIHQHLEKGEHPLYLLSMISYQFRNLLLVKDLSKKYQSFYLISKILNLPSYVIKKNHSQAQKFTIEELKKIYQKIFKVDHDIKAGRINPEVALDMLIAEI